MDPVAAWAAALDRLQADTVSTELVARGAEAPSERPWVEPDLPGTLPAALRERAEQLLARQLVARDALLGLLESLRHRTVYDEARQPGPARPVYVDVDA